MKLPLQVSAQGLELGRTSRAAIRAAAEKLETFFPRLMGCRVSVTVPHRRPQAAPIRYNVRIDLTVPGEELVIKRQAHDQLLDAIQDAFRVAGRRLQDHATRVPAVRPPEARTVPARARVARVFPGEEYGFLETEDGREVYFHRHSVLHDGFDRLAPGSLVRFSEEEGDQGPQASTVEVVRRRGGARMRSG